MMTLRGVRDVLARIKLTPSCIDMGWKWEVDFSYGKKVDGGDGILIRGYLIRTTFRRPDRTTGVIGTGYGGWHFVPVDADATTVVKRAYVAMEAILRHELMEAVHYDGDRIFDPHHDLSDLSAACEHREMREKLG